jgi:hypothetical protein
VFDTKGRALEPKEGLLVTRAGVRNPVWFPRALQPTSYEARVHYKLHQDIELAGGDFLLLNLKQEGGTAVFKHGVYAGEPTIEKSPQQANAKGDWIVAVPQNEPKDLATDSQGTGLQLMVTLENKIELAPRGDILKQIRPQFVWLEVKGNTDNLPLVRWGNLELYPAPAWQMNVEVWPDRTKPVVSAWWSERDLSAFSLAPLERDVKKPLGQDFLRADADVDKQIYKVESVRVEEHPIDGISKSCLVVRMRYARGKPVLVRSPQLSVRGHEHHYYTEANQYTGIFWPVTSADADRPFTLEVISLAKMKDETAGEGFTTQVELPEPNDRYKRPQPVPVKPGAGD